MRHKTEREVKIPAYEALREDRGLGQHMLGALLRGVSTREYHEVLPKMAATVGVSRSAISRQAIEASVEQLKQLRERRWDGVEILVIYIDGELFPRVGFIVTNLGTDGRGGGAVPQPARNGGAMHQGRQVCGEGDAAEHAIGSGRMKYGSG